jgi:predicted transcriptional regulator of viral defense system
MAELTTPFLPDAPISRNRPVAVTKRDQILRLLQKTRVLRARDVVAAGIAQTYLNQLLAEGIIDRPARGLYVLAEDEPTEQRSLVEAARRVSQGVVCLLSALQFHGLTTQAPFEVWLAIDRKARMPKSESPTLRVVRFSGKALSYGVQGHTLEGVRVWVYSPAKTVADCFKYRHKVGIDVALEALRDCLRQKKAPLDELWEAAKTCRMANIIRPYLEALA